MLQRCLTSGDIKGGSLVETLTVMSGKQSLNIVHKVFCCCCCLKATLRCSQDHREDWVMTTQVSPAAYSWRFYNGLNCVSLKLTLLLLIRTWGTHTFPWKGTPFRYLSLKRDPVRSSIAKLSEFVINLKFLFGLYWRLVYLLLSHAKMFGLRPLHWLEMMIM